MIQILKTKRFVKKVSTCMNLSAVFYEFTALKHKFTAFGEVFNC